MGLAITKGLCNINIKGGYQIYWKGGSGGRGGGGLVVRHTFHPPAPLL